MSDLLSPDRIEIALPGASKADVINALVDLLRDHEAIGSLDAVRTAIFEREKVMSTGVGKGLGLPHAKTPAAMETVAAFATTAQPVDFGAIDDVPVRLVLLLVGPESDKSQHIKILGRVSRLISRDAIRERLIEATSPDEVLRILNDGEVALRS